MVFKSSSQEFQITQLKLEFYDNQLHITYDLGNKDSPGKFKIRIEITKQNGESIIPKTIKGDLGGNIKPGNNKESSGIWKRILSTSMRIFPWNLKVKNLVNPSAKAR